MSKPGPDARRTGGPGGQRRVAVVVLAAGASSRFGGTKALAKIGGKTLIGRVLDAIPSNEVAETVVVVGHGAQLVSRTIGARKNVRVVANPDYRSGMGGSIRAGVVALSKEADGAMLLQADQPFVTRHLLRRMVRAFEAGSRKGSIVAAAQGDLVSPPVIFARRYFRELAALEGDVGAKTVIERHAGSLRRVLVRSRNVLKDIDTRRDLEEARRLLEP